MKKLFIYSTLFLFLLSCDDEHENLSNVKKHEIIDINKFIDKEIKNDKSVSGINASILAENLDLIARGLYELTNDQIFVDLVATKCKNAPNEKDFEVMLSELETEYRASGKELIDEMVNSLIIHNAAFDEVDKLKKIYKEFNLFGNNVVDVCILAPQYDSTIFNQNLFLNNKPKYISFNQLFDIDSLPSYETNTSPNFKIINKFIGESNLTWIVFSKPRNKGIENNPIFKPNWFAKCYCVIEFDSSNSPYSTCEEGPSSKGERCGRTFFGNCTGKCASYQ